VPRLVVSCVILRRMSKKLSSLLCALPLLSLLACEPTLIPNTRVEDNSQNREVLDFIERYRKAI
jgi:hypothetical protein